MNLIKNLPGPLLVFMGAFSLSFGGLIVKSFEGNTNFIISTQILFLAIFGYLFLKEKISIITLASIILAISGVILMVGNSLTSG